MKVPGDRVPSGRPVRRRPVHAAGSAGPPGDAAGAADGGRPAADGQGRGGQGGDQPEHRAQGVPGTRVRRSRLRASWGRDVRHPDPDGQVAGRARSAARGAARLARPGASGRDGHRKHRGPVRHHIPHPDRGDSHDQPRSGGRGPVQAVRASRGVVRLHPCSPARPGRWARRPQRRRQDHPAAHRGGIAAANSRPHRGARRPASVRPSTTGQGRLRRPGHAHVCRPVRR